MHFSELGYVLGDNGMESLFETFVLHLFSLHLYIITKQYHQLSRIIYEYKVINTLSSKSLLLILINYIFKHL